MANISVATFTELNTACQTSNTITVTAPITVTSTITIPAGVTVSLTGAQLSTSTAALRHFQLNGDLELNNITLDGGTTGGGIVMGNTNGTVSSTLTIDSGTVIQNCSAQEGAGVLANQNANIIMNAGEITGNTAIGSVGGGGIFMNAGTFTMTGGLIYHNSAVQNGGGLYINLGATATITGTSTPTATLPALPAIGTPAIYGNTVGAGTQSANGGGIFNYGTLNATDALIANNIVNAAPTTNNGGGLLATDNAVSILANCLITGNSAPNGGGISAYLGAAVTLDGTTVTNNDAVFTGGGIRLDNNGGAPATLTLEGNNIISNNNCYYTTTSYGTGGGMWLGTSVVNVVNGTQLVTNNTSLDGAGIYTSEVSLTDFTVSDNKASRNGGGICYMLTTATTVSLSNTTVSSNQAAANGGGLYVASNGTAGANVDLGPNVVVSANIATNGGGYYVAP